MCLYMYARKTVIGIGGPDIMEVDSPGGLFTCSLVGPKLIFHDRLCIIIVLFCLLPYIYMDTASSTICRLTAFPVVFV